MFIEANILLNIEDGENFHRVDVEQELKRILEDADLRSDISSYEIKGAQVIGYGAPRGTLLNKEGYDANAD